MTRIKAFKDNAARLADALKKLDTAAFHKSMLADPAATRESR